MLTGDQRCSAHTFSRLQHRYVRGAFIEQWVTNSEVPRGEYSRQEMYVVLEGGLQLLYDSEKREGSVGPDCRHCSKTK